MIRNEIVKKVFCLLNPLSCDGLSVKKWKTIKRIFDELEIDCELISFEGDLSDATIKLLRENKNLNKITLAGIGGDGTHCAIINGMMKFKNSSPDSILPYYSIIPLGTGNNIAKSFRLSRRQGLFSCELRRTILGTVYGAEFSVDIASVNGIYFLDAFTVGVDAHILAGRNTDKGKISKIPIIGTLFKGYPIYVLNVLKSLKKCKHLDCKVEADGKIFYEGHLFNVIFNNTRIYAGEFDPTDNAIANDGFLDMAVHTGRRNYLFSYLSSYRHLPRSFRNFAKKIQTQALHLKIQKATVSFSKKIPAQVDGELISPSEKYSVEIIPRAITLKIPVEPA